MHWVHTHGLGELGAFDFDILTPPGSLDRLDRLSSGWQRVPVRRGVRRPISFRYGFRDAGRKTSRRRTRTQEPEHGSPDRLGRRAAGRAVLRRHWVGIAIALAFGGGSTGAMLVGFAALPLAFGLSIGAWRALLGAWVIAALAKAALRSRGDEERFRDEMVSTISRARRDGAVVLPGAWVFIPTALAWAHWRWP